MADISYGPVISMPYSRRELPDGSMCDRHRDRKAVARIQGETDSFGCEYIDACSECVKQIQDYRNSPEARTGMCEWCKREATDLRNARDYDEGMAGRIYRVCGPCIKRRNEEAAEELRDARYAIAALLLAAGGQVVVKPKDILRLEAKHAIETFDDPASGARIFTLTKPEVQP